jgi:hypothetical protein
MGNSYALEAWHSMNTTVNPNIQFVADLRRSPIRKSSPLTPHISGHTLFFGEAWSTLNVFYVGNLIENGHWKHIEDFNPDRCTTPTIRRLAANLKTAEAFLRHHYPNLPLQINFLTSPSHFYTIKQPNGQLTPLPMPSKTTYRIFFLITSNEHVIVNGKWVHPCGGGGGSKKHPRTKKKRRYLF